MSLGSQHKEESPHMASITRTSWGISTRQTVGRLVIWCVLCIGAALMIVPLAWMISSSLKTSSQIWVVPPEWIPDPVQWGNYPKALTALPFGTYTLNTLRITVPVLLGTLLSASLCGYGFARLEFPGRDLFFMLFLTFMVKIPC